MSTSLRILHKCIQWFPWHEELVEAVWDFVRWIRWRRLSAEEREQDVVTLSTLSNHRFGNQFFQYVFLRTYALEHDLRFEFSRFMGERLFGSEPARITRKLPEFRVRADDMSLPPHGERPRNIDFRGYFQYPTSYYSKHEHDIKAWFQPTGEIGRLVEEAWHRLQQRGKTVVGLHLRRGDYGYDYFFIAPNAWYRVWLQSIWPSLEDPVLFIASDEPAKVVPDFADLDPVIAEDLGIALPELEFYLDFYLLTRCHQLAISNSIFSFSAAMLNESASTFMRPVLPKQCLEPFDPWESEPLLRDARVEDYPQIPGIIKPKQNDSAADPR